MPAHPPTSPATKILTWLAAIAILLGRVSPAQAVTLADANTIFLAHNRAFFYTNASGGFFLATNGAPVDHKTDFWMCAEQLEMTLDAYERSGNAACLNVFSNGFNGFLADHGTNWQENPYNDDIFWMVIACARACQLTGCPVYRDAAKLNFDLCYQRAWDPKGGGLWWKTDRASKNACVNGPGAIAAYLLSEICHDRRYRAKSKAIYAWERKVLFDAGSGRVRDNINRHGKFGFVAFTYNEGTFIGAANFLGHVKDAQLAAKFTRDQLCHDGILPAYASSGDLAGFNGIFVRWLARFMKDRHLEKDYGPWLQANADAAWRNRRRSDDLSWSDWSTPTPSEPLNSWACSSSVVVLQVAPLQNAPATK